MDSILAKDYPRPVREAYAGALRRTVPTDRHRHLLRLGEISVAYLASLSFADYRRARGDDLDPAVEDSVQCIDRVTAGGYLGIFNASQKALGRSAIFDVRGYDVSPKLDHGALLVAAVRAIEYASRLGASDVRLVVTEADSGKTKAVRWLQFWDEFVAYRNKVIHADDKGWPIDGTDYYEVMTPLLEAAVVEALRTEYTERVMLEYPIAVLTDVSWKPRGLTLHFDGEYRGAPLVTAIDVVTPEAQQLEIGASYVLTRDAGAWGLYSRFFDLKQKGVAEELFVAQHPTETGAATSDDYRSDPSGRDGGYADLSAEGWFALAHWAKETGNLTPWQRQFAFNLGLRMKRGSPPSAKQLVHAERLLDEAQALGFEAGT